MLPVLRCLADQKEHPLSGVRAQIASQLKLTDAELAQRLARGSQTVFANRIAWAVQYLKSAAALQSVARGIYKITPRGQALLEGSPREITLTQLRQIPEFREFEGKETSELQKRSEQEH